MFGLGDKYVVGYDISNEYAQISYFASDDDVPVTLSLVDDAEDYNIPACLFKRSEVNQWYYGREAINIQRAESGELVTNLWEHALVGDMVKVVDSEFDPIALLALFIKRSFTLLKNIRMDKIAGIMFTVPSLTKRAIEVLDEVVGIINLTDIDISFCGREECIFYYIVHQSHELWQHDVWVYDFSFDDIKGYRFFINRMAKPAVAFVDTHETYIRRDDHDKDQKFLLTVKENMSESIASLVYLIGQGFDESWCNESLKELCRNRRVFRGNNLYSKGACYAMHAKMKDDDMDKSLIFLSKDKLKVNIGMQVIRVNKESYFAILDAGQNWYDAKKEFDVILEDGNDFEIVLTPLDGNNVRNVLVILDGLTQKEPKTTRLHMSFFMESDCLLRLCATDMGFGELNPTTYQLFSKQISLQ